MDQETTARQAQRAESLAALARPVQHEVNNLLTVLHANVDLLRRSVPEGRPQAQLERIAVAAKRMESATRAILSLARRPVPGDASFAPAEALRQLAPLLHLLLPAPGALALEIPEDEAWQVAADRAAFDEAVLALGRAAAAGLPRGATLGLTLTQAAGEVTLRLAWPEAAPADAMVAAALAALGAEALGTEGWRLGWPRLGG